MVVVVVHTFNVGSTYVVSRWEFALYPGCLLCM